MSDGHWHQAVARGDGGSRIAWVCPLAAAGVLVDRQGRQLGDLAVGLGMAKALSKMLPARRGTRCAMMLFSCKGLKEKPLWSGFEVREEDFVFSFN